jgi:hypothetical protein
MGFGVQGLFTTYFICILGRMGFRARVFRFGGLGFLHVQSEMHGTDIGLLRQNGDTP